MKVIAKIITIIFLSVNIFIPSVYANITNVTESNAQIEQNESIVNNGQTELIKNENSVPTLQDEKIIQQGEAIKIIEVQNSDIPNDSNVNVDNQKIYTKIKKTAPSTFSTVLDNRINSLKNEEYKADYEAAANMDYLVPMTDSNFEVVLAYKNGDYSFVEGTNTIDEAIAISKQNIQGNNYDIIPCVIDSDGIVVYSTNSMARFIKHENGVLVDQIINIYPNSNLSGDSTYINHYAVDDAPVIEDDGVNVRVMVTGYKGWVRKNIDNKNYDVVIIPMNQAQNPSYYYVEDGQLYHYISTDVTAASDTSGFIMPVCVAPNYLQPGTKYYSYDGNYFYNNLDSLISDLKGNSSNNAINSNSTFYNYYLYLPFRSKTIYTASEINEFIDACTTNIPDSKLKGLGNGLINAQNKYGINAAMILGVAINESFLGMSDYALDRNNLFGIGAIDSNPDAAYYYDSVADCVYDFAFNTLSKGYADPEDASLYYGGFLGGKNLGANRQYASDPFWGEKAATHMFIMDKYLSGNDLSKLSDYNYNQLAIYSSPTQVIDSNKQLLYNVEQDIFLNATFVGVPILLTSNNKLAIDSNEYYEIYPERQTQLDIGGGPEFDLEYDWNKKGYIKSDSVTLINTGTYKAPEVMYLTHVESIGWQDWKYNGELSGTTGLEKQLEAIKIQLKNYPYATIRYSTHIQDIGWQEWKYNGELSGTTGLGKQLEGIKIEATGLPEDVELQYRVHIQDIGWQDWRRNGDVAGTSGQSKQLESIEIRIVEKTPSIKYKTHVQDIGWQNYVYDGSMSGTSGQSKRLEGIIIDSTNLPAGAYIRYKTHVQDFGWQEWKVNGEFSGTSGKAKRLEGIQIELVNAPGYQVKYRTHIQDIGWQEWKFDGELSGTTGLSKRLEGIEIKIVKNENPTKPEIKVTGQNIVDFAYGYLGVPYAFGAKGPNSFDDRGFTSFVYRNAASIEITETTSSQLTQGVAVNYSDLQLGDLVFTNNGEHVGIYVGNNSYIHASQPGDVVKISPITSFYAARRILAIN